MTAHLFLIGEDRRYFAHEHPIPEPGGYFRFHTQLPLPGFYRILTDFYGIPPENLVTQGYGERYLKVRTELAERLNRRVQVRRITPLITLASN